MSNQSKAQKPNSIEIAVNQVPEGITLCKQNILDFLDDARNIIEKGKLHHAYVSFEFALEEFGKIVMLKEALAVSNNGKISLDKHFRDHIGKSEKAIERLGPDFKSVYKMHWFLAQCLGVWPLFFGTATGHQTRLNCAFVNYKNNKWTIGATIDKDKFIHLINELERRTMLE
jgi:AbiV family abortive infection protein